MLQIYNRREQNCQDQSAYLIGLFGAVGGLEGVDEPFWHQQQEACYVVQRLAAADLWLCDDRPRLGRTVGREAKIDQSKKRVTKNKQKKKTGDWKRERRSGKGEKVSETEKIKGDIKCTWPKPNRSRLSHRSTESMILCPHQISCTLFDGTAEEIL